MEALIAMHRLYWTMHRLFALCLRHGLFGLATMIVERTMLLAVVSAGLVVVVL